MLVLMRAGTILRFELISVFSGLCRGSAAVFAAAWSLPLIRKIEGFLG